MRKVIVVGAGGHGRAVAEMLVARLDCALVGFLDDAAQQPIWGRPILGPIAEPLERYARIAPAAIVAIGNNRVRETLQLQLEAAGFELLTIVHPHAFVSPSAVLGSGCAVMAGAIVGTEARIGNGVILNIGAAVDHHCEVHDFAHLGTSAAMAGGSVLGRRAWMQAGAALGYRVRVDEDGVLAPTEGRVKVSAS